VTTAPAPIGIVGASSLVGGCLLERLSAVGAPVFAFTRGPLPADAGPIRWRTPAAVPCGNGPISDWIVLSPVWTVESLFGLMESAGARRVIALSSTSRFTKAGSSSPSEREIAQALARGEDALVRWADGHGVRTVVLRPTLIYGRDADGNVATIARFVRRFGVFPVLGDALGLRQPVHCDDVADACLRALRAHDPARAYELSGGEVLSYRAMVERVFAALGRRPRIVRVPMVAFRAAIQVARLLPGRRGWTPAMAERMNRDMAFAHDEASRDLGFAPRPFRLEPRDLPGAAHRPAPASATIAQRTR
jgi:uncharacterized protein YbjT (DUF2867 family)